MSYVDMPGTGTTRIDTPDSAALSLTGDLDVRALIVLNDYTPAAIRVLMNHWLGAGNLASWTFYVNTAGTLGFSWSVSGNPGTATAKTSTAATGRTDGLHLWVRVTHDVVDAASNTVTFYTSTDPIATAPGSVTWSQLGSAVGGGGNTSHFNSTNEIELGSQDDGAAFRMIGRFYYGELRSGIGGTIVGSPDFRDATQITTPNTVFTDTQGNAWTLRTAATWIFEGTGTGASTLAGVTSAGTGVYTPAAITGSGASTLAGVTSAGTGVFTGTGPPPSPRHGCCGGRRRCCRRDRVSA